MPADGPARPLRTPPTPARPPSSPPSETTWRTWWRRARPGPTAWWRPVPSPPIRSSGPPADPRGWARADPRGWAAGTGPGIQYGWKFSVGVEVEAQARPGPEEADEGSVARA